MNLLLFPEELLENILFSCYFLDIHSFWISVNKQGNFFYSWNFWREKAQRDLGVSPEFFNLYRKEKNISAPARYFELLFMHETRLYNVPKEFVFGELEKMTLFFLFFHRGNHEDLEKIISDIDKQTIKNFLDNGLLEFDQEKKISCLRILEKRLSKSLICPRLVYFCERVQHLLQTENWPELFVFYKTSDLKPDIKIDVLSSMLNKKNSAFLCLLLHSNHDFEEIAISFANLLVTGDKQRIEEFLSFMLKEKNLDLLDEAKRNDVFVCFNQEQMSFAKLFSCFAYISNSPEIIKEYGNLVPLSDKDKVSCLVSGYLYKPNTNFYYILKREKISWDEKLQNIVFQSTSPEAKFLLLRKNYP